MFRWHGVAAVWAATMAAPALGGGAICTSANSAFATSAPAGWEADYDTAQRMRLCVVYRVAGFSFHSSPAVIYPNLIAHPTTLPERDLERFIEDDIATFRKESPSLRVRRRNDVAAVSGLRFRVVEFIGAHPPNEFEEVAYLAANDAVFLGVYSARRKADLERYRPAFREFLDGTQRISRGQIVNQYSGLKKKAEEDRKRAPEFEAAYLRAIMNSLGEGMGQCAKAGPGFEAVVMVSSQGMLQEIVFAQDDELSRCLRSHLVGVAGPPPPFGPFHFLLDMRIRP
jgi:hypothetical protein